MKESFRKLRAFTIHVKKVSSDLQNVKTNSFKKVSEKSTRKRIEAWKNYATQKVAAPNLFSLAKQLNILFMVAL